MSTSWTPSEILERAQGGNSLALPAALIEDQWQPGADDALVVHDPATGAPLARLAPASAQQVEAAVRAARAAASVWGTSRRAQRASVLDRIADGLEAWRQPLLSLQRLSNGKPRSEAEMDISDAVATFRYYARMALESPDFDQESIELADGAFRARRRYEPCGVAALVLPWNFPIVTTAWKLAPALAAGCAVIVKPSELAPLPEIALAEAVRSAGLPSGAVSWIFGGRSTGEALVRHPRVDKVSFTGSTATGIAVMHAAADRVGRVSLELGGKSALLAFESADVRDAVDLAVAGIFTNAGQMCSATSRVLVHRKLFARFIELFCAAADALKPASREPAEGQYGPLISRGQLQKVMGVVARAISDGLIPITGGGMPTSAGGGYFFQPTIFRDVPVTHALWTDEIFGPVACVRSFDSEEEALAIANSTDYGLAATVVTADAEQARRVEATLRAGMVWTNVRQIILPDVGWGGFGRSGLGRELGILGLRAFQEAKHLVTGNAAHAAEGQQGRA